VTDWTDTRVASLRQLWRSDLTTSEIGNAIGVSKNAVIGKAKRLGLGQKTNRVVDKEPTYRIHRSSRDGYLSIRWYDDGKEYSRATGTKDPEKAAACIPAAIAYHESRKRIALLDSLGRHLSDLGHNECRWATTPHKVKPSEHRFCGLPTADGDVYCDRHNVKKRMKWVRGQKKTDFMIYKGSAA